MDEKDITKKFYNNYVLANAITIDIASGESEDESGLTLDQAKDLLKKYKDRLAKGEKFESIYHDYEEKYMAAEDDGHDHSHDEMAVVYGSDETNEASEFFDAINKLSTGDVKILTAEDKSQIILVEKQDIKKDKDQYKAYRESVIYLLKGNEFEADFEDFCKGLKIEYIESATKRLKAEKIDLATEQQ